jgi:murein DD-endopeptidase MepM/ murein hydrolase activator NlpD
LNSSPDAAAMLAERSGQLSSRRQVCAAEVRVRARRGRAPARRPRVLQTRLKKPPLRKRVFGAVAMVFAALLAVSVSLPALAVNPVASGALPPSTAAAGRVHSLPASAAGSIAVERDGYKVSKVQELTPGAYAQTAGTFVNYVDSPIQWPFLVGVPITTDFGPRVPPCAGCSSFHKGIDMNPGVNTPIQAIADGIVREVSDTDKSGLGVYAVIDHMIDGRLVSSVYAHMAEGSLALKPGRPVVVGQRVGNVGNTGQSTGPHLHFEILLDGVTPTDPFAWLTDRVRPL